MKKLPTLLLIFAISLFFSKNVAHATAPDDKAFVLNYLEETGQYLVKMLEGVDQKSWNFRPADNKWTIGETAEHILSSEKKQLAHIKQVLATQEPDASKVSDIPSFDVLLTRLHNRYTYKVKTIAELEPNGEWISKREFISAFQENRRNLINFISSTDAPLHQYFTPTPVGTVDLLQFATVAAGHGARHTLQVEEIMAEIGLKTTTVSFGGRVKVNIDANKREDLRTFFTKVLRLQMENGERFDRVHFDGGGFVAFVYHTDKSQLLPEKYFANAMQLGLLVPAQQYESLKYRMKAFGIKQYHPPYEVDTHKHFYFHAPGGQIFRLVKQQVVE